MDPSTQKPIDCYPLQRVYPLTFIGLAMIVLVSLASSLKSGDFKLLTQAVSPNLVYFFLTLGMLIVSCPLYFLGKKYSWPIDLIIPIYAIIYIICLLPVWYEKPR